MGSHRLILARSADQLVVNGPPEAQAWRDEGTSRRITPDRIRGRRRAVPGRSAEARAIERPSLIERSRHEHLRHARAGRHPKAVTDVTCDMSEAFITGVGEHLPAAQITFDRFHTVALLSKALDEVRRAEVKAEPGALKGTRYLWLKRPEHLTEAQKTELAYLKVLHATLATVRAYAWRLAFDAFYDQPAEDAEAYLLRWCLGALHSGLEPLIGFVETVFEHWGGIVAWHTKHINTGVLEAINSLVQAAKRRARGYRTKKNLIAMTYLIAGKLDLAVIHTRLLNRGSTRRSSRYTAARATSAGRRTALLARGVAAKRPVNAPVTISATSWTAGTVRSAVPCARWRS
jgi:hypothetical protein